MITHTNAVRHPNVRPATNAKSRISNGSSNPVTNSKPLLAEVCANMKCATVSQTGVALPPWSVSVEK